MALPSAGESYRRVADAIPRRLDEEVGPALYWRLRRGYSMGIAELLGEKRREILATATRHGASNLRIFGSVARGDAGPDSDVDFLVDFDSESSLLDHVDLLQDLEDLLGRHVDIVSARALHWYIKDRVLAEAVPL